MNHPLLAVLALFGCAPEPEIPACEGGGDPSLTIGIDDGDFVALSDGDEMVVQTDPANGAYRLIFDFRIEGLDATDSVTGVTRLGFGDDPTEDYLAQVTLACDGDGPSSYTAAAVLADEYQSEESVAALDGSALTVDSAFTDARGVTADASVALGFVAE